MPPPAWVVLETKPEKEAECPFLFYTWLPLGPNSIMIFTAGLKQFLLQLPFFRLLSLLLRYLPTLSHTALHKKRLSFPPPSLLLDQ
jgi:hypothetical protein